MLAWLLVICSVIIMVKAADIEHRSQIFWGGYTFVCCVGCAYLFPRLLLINVILGLVVSFMSMFVLNTAQKRG